MPVAELAHARLYLVSGARIAAGDVHRFIPELADAGVGIYQLREKEMEAGDVLRVAEPILAACGEAGIPFVINDRPDVARVLGADGVHVGQNDLPPRAAREVLEARAPDDAPEPRRHRIVGLSTHAEQEVDRAVGLGDALDYIAVGPVNATPTKPGRPGTGVDLVQHAARSIPPAVPWFVTGGMSAEMIPEVREAGASRVVVVRAITEAADPVAAAAAIFDALG